MRVLHIVNRLSSVGNGIVNLAVDLALEQKAAGHEVAFLAGPEGGYEALLQSAGVLIFPVDQRRSLRNLPRALLGFRRVLRQFAPDIVHAHMQTGLYFALPWTKLFRIPLLAQLHNVHDRTASTMRWADRLVAVSSAVERAMRAQGVPPRKLRVILNGTLHSRRLPQLASLQPLPLHHPAILTVAGMNHRKGVAELLVAFDAIAEEFPACHLYLAGEGPERVLFEQQASALKAKDRVHFCGFVPEPQRLMLACDVFVLASRRDSFGLVLVEAREAGCAIVATDVDGIPEALDGGAAGVLVPPRSPEALATALRALLLNEERRKSLQVHARANLDRFTIARMADEFMVVYREIEKHH